jgi:hypothetical protein
VSAVETPPAEPTAPPRQCPRCAATLRPEQDWCLNCGAGLGARVAAPRGWRWPVAVVGGLLALAAVAFALALVELASNAETVGQATPVAPVPTPAATATPAASSTADPTQIPPASGGTASPPQVSDWPAGKTGYTVILESAAERTAADARAQELAGQGLAVGVLDTSGYASLTPDRFVVFSGQFETREEARLALRNVQGRVEGAKVGRVAPA